MSDLLSDIITLLRPRTVVSKVISAAGPWSVSYSAFERPSFCTVLEGSCLLKVEAQEEITLEAGDFVFMPATPGFTLSSFAQMTPQLIDPNLTPTPTEEIRHGVQEGKPDMRMLGGHFVFDSPDVALLVSLLPALLHVRGVASLSVLVQLVRDECTGHRQGRDHVISRLMEVLLVEALRSTANEQAPAGLLRGLADSKLAAAMRSMHNAPAHNWTVEELAKQTALSRSAFFQRFTHAVGHPPMEYLLGWRMAMAKNLLRNNKMAIAAVAEQVGYSSASTFSTAFSRHVGQPPGRYARLL